MYTVRISYAWDETHLPCKFLEKIVEKNLVFSRKNRLTRPEPCNIINQYDMSQEDVGTKAPEQAFHDIVNLNYRK